MGFLSEIASEFTHSGSDSAQQQGGYGGSGSAPPQVQLPWVARWDEPAGRWIYINEQTGARTFEHPGGSYQDAGYYQGGPPGMQQQQGGYGGGYEGEYREEEKSSGGGHGLMYAGVAGAAGLAGGALLMHEGEKVGMSMFGFFIPCAPEMDFGICG
ncbi:hypothetical protein K490DRAFT_70016 [Saccharata proteae CBS 121410]|uniref:WW domain-containing protein n=1 Tax=Saccharata proteae CBS 121410 TaxID=1314787 RepID=A0A9P4LTQ0_9PEZI|nr:hypothetical protein K490DRAFT_70016 [Saccharata proteae CBS 121410]